MKRGLAISARRVLSLVALVTLACQPGPGGPLALLVRGLVAGASIWAAQAALLRGVLSAPTTCAWAALVSVGWAVTAASGLDLAPKRAVFRATGWWAFQLATGLTLAYLLRRPARALAPAPARGAVV